MRLLHVTDFHFNRPWFDWLASVAPEYDVCCLSGVFLDLLSDWDVSPTRQARWVGDWLEALPSRLCVCSGNHDWWPIPERVIDVNAEAAWLKRRRRAGLLVDGDSEVIGGYRFACKPWVGSVAFGEGLPVVLLAHGPPEGTGVSSDLGNESEDLEMTALLRHLPPQSLVLSGHIHDPKRCYDTFGRITCFNPGFAQEQDAPNHIVIDLDSREARFTGWGRTLGPVRF